jgi:hypothetical protein
MISLGLLVRLEAKPGKEKDVAAFLKQGLQLANQETTTELWFALRLGPSTFAISMHLRMRREGRLTSMAQLPKHCLPRHQISWRHRLP